MGRCVDELMDVWMDGEMDGTGRCVHELMDVWMDGEMDGWMGRCVHELMDGWEDGGLCMRMVSTILPLTHSSSQFQ